jgi:hypothetical protein
MSHFQLSPTGDDSAPEGPWATLAGARDALRRLRAAGRFRGHATVQIAAGHYPLSEPVAFGPADGHTTYRAAEGDVVFDGGRALNGFTETTHQGRRAWMLDLPEVASGRWFFRSLFADGVRRPRARLPKFSPDAEGVHHTFRIGEIRFPEKRKLFDGDHVFKPLPGDLQPWSSLRDAEIVLLHYWVETRLPQPHLDPRTGWVSCARRSVFNLYESFNPLLARYYVDNLLEALTEPGEWYLDRALGRLIYLPLPDETLADTRLVAPVLARFLEITGETYNRGSSVNDPLGERTVDQLHFHGLAFRHSDWFQPSADMLPHDSAAAAGVTDVPLGSAPQSAAHVPAAVTFRWARGCRFERNTVERTGFTALEFGPGCRDCDARHNTLQNLGGGGVKLGGAELDGAPMDRTGHIRFTDNTVRRVGRVFHQSCGVLLTHAFDCEIAHNEIAHTCYTGISAGWSWGFRETITRNIRIENNHIHHICEKVLSDNGGIYLLGVQPGTVVRGNHIHHVSAADYGGAGIYPDEGCSHVVIEHNWVHDVQGSALGIHFARELVVRHNVFARPGAAFAGIGRVEPGLVQATLLRNLFIGPAASLYEGAYKGDIRDGLVTDANVIALAPDAIPPVTHPEWRGDVPRRRSFEEWRLSGHDRLSLVGPLVFEESATAFALPPDSPALASGFKPHDWSVCGPRSVETP